MTFRRQLAVTVVPCNTPGNEKGWWFGDSLDEDEEFNNEEAQKAVALCFTCPLRIECLTDALTTNERYGVRGASTPAQRDFMLSRGRR